MRARPQLWFWLVVAATLWAAVCRLPGLASLPPQAYVDEAWYNLAGRNLLQSGALQVFYPTFWGGMRPLLVDLSALIQAIGFHSLVATRAVTAAVGVVCVPLTFACADELLRREAWPAGRRRLTAAVAAAVAPNLLFQLVASRVGYAPILIPALTLLAVWQMRRAERTGQWRGWVAAGLAVGLSQYVNINGAFVAAALGLLALLDLARAPHARRGAWFRGLLLMGALAVLSALPILLFFARQPQWLFARASAITPQTNHLQFFLSNAWLIALSFSVRGDPNLRENLAGRPMLDLLQSIGFWVGLAWCAWRWRRSATARDLPVWLAVTVVPSLLTADAPQFERMIGMAAPVAILVAVGWSEIAVWLLAALRRRGTAHQVFSPFPLRSQIPVAERRGVGGPGDRSTSPPVLTLALCLGLAASSAATAYAYFVLYPAAPGLAAAFTATPAAVAQQMIQRSLAERVFVERTPEVDDAFAFDYLFPRSAVQRLDFRLCLPRSDGRATATTYVVLAQHDPQTTSLLRQLYPAAAVSTIQPETAALVGELDVVQVPAGARLPALGHPASADFAGGLQLLGYDWSGPSVAAGQPLYITLYWRAGSDLGQSDTAFLHVGQGTARSPLVAQHDGLPCQGLYPTQRWRAGDVVPDSFAVVIPAGTPPGAYPLLAGWYDSQTQQRLPLVASDSALPDNRAFVANLQVTPH